MSPRRLALALLVLVSILCGCGLVGDRGAGATPTEPSRPSATSLSTASGTPAHREATTSTLRPSPPPTRTPAPTPTGTPLPPPGVVASYPIDGDLAVVGDHPLVIVFDRPVDKDLILANLVITPSVEGQADWPSPERLVYASSEPWGELVYQVNLPLVAEGENGEPGRNVFSLRFACGGRGVPVPVLMYHHVKELEASASDYLRTWTVSPDAFADQMTYLVQHGWESISPTQLAAYFNSGEPLPPRPIIISIDDGNDNVYTEAHAVFMKTGLRPVLFIVPQFLGYGAYLEWDQLKEMVAAGFAVGSHTYDHSDLRKVDDAELRRQLVESREVLVERLGVSVDALSYPYGSYDQRILQALKEHGYTTAFTLNQIVYQSPSDPYRLNRLRISYGTTLEEFAERLP